MGRWTQQDPEEGEYWQGGVGDAYVCADDAPVMTDPSGRATCFNQLGGANTIQLFSTIAIVTLIGAVGVFAGTYWQATDILNSCQATGQH